MSFEIKLHGRIGCALQDLSREEVTRTLQSLASPQPGGMAHASHEIRKQVKKLRALLALVREPLGKKRYHDENSALQNVGRALAAKRDAEVLLKTLKHLQQRFLPGRHSPFIQALRTAFLAQERRCLAELSRSNTEAAITASFREILAGIADWPVADYGWKELRQAVRRSYERTRTSYRKAKDSPTAPRLHRWRKRVKELWFHLCLLRRASPARMEELAQDFEVLGEFLGDDHDLLVLKAALEERRSTHQHRAAAETFSELIDLRREELLDAAFDLGERLHEDSPADFAREIDELRALRRKRRRKGKKLGQQLAATE